MDPCIDVVCESLSWTPLLLLLVRPPTPPSPCVYMIAYMKGESTTTAAKTVEQAADLVKAAEVNLDVFSIRSPFPLPPPPLPPLPLPRSSFSPHFSSCCPPSRFFPVILLLSSPS